MTFLSEIRLDAQAAYRWGRSVNLRGPDTGYLAHCVLAASYGEHYPRPFVVASEGRSIRLLGYTEVDDKCLSRTRQLGADPEVSRIINSEASKQMPDDWAPGDILRFQLRTTPLRRSKGKEFDAYRGELDDKSRDERYQEWLADKLSPAATLVTSEIKRFSLMRVLRRDGNVDRQGRSSKHFHVPDVTFEGTLKVHDPSIFNRLLAKGVGRHKAFGFGALLLRPPR